MIKDATLQPYSKHSRGCHLTRIPARKPATRASPAPVVSTTGDSGSKGCTYVRYNGTCIGFFDVLNHFS